MPSRHRPAVVPPASSRTRTDRRAPLLRFRLLPFGVRWSRRTALSNRLRAIPLRRYSQPRHPRQEVGSPVRFLAPRVWRCCSVACAARRRRAGHSWPISFGPTYRIRAGCYRDLAGTVKVPATPMGFTFAPFAVLLPSAGDDACSDVSHPPAVSPRAAASFIVAGSPPLVAVRPKVCGRGSWGLAPPDEPCRVICRPRYSFYA